MKETVPLTIPVTAPSGFAMAASGSAATTKITVPWVVAYPCCGRVGIDTEAVTVLGPRSESELAPVCKSIENASVKVYAALLICTPIEPGR